MPLFSDDEPHHDRGRHLPGGLGRLSRQRLGSTGSCGSTRRPATTSAAPDTSTPVARTRSTRCGHEGRRHRSPQRPGPRRSDRAKHARNLNASVLVVSVLNGSSGRYPDKVKRYPDAPVSRCEAGWKLDEDGFVRSWLETVDVVYSAETFYDQRLAGLGPRSRDGHGHPRQPRVRAPLAEGGRSATPPCGGRRPRGGSSTSLRSSRSSRSLSPPTDSARSSRTTVRAGGCMWSARRP